MHYQDVTVEILNKSSQVLSAINELVGHYLFHLGGSNCMLSLSNSLLGEVINRVTQRRQSLSAEKE